VGGDDLLMTGIGSFVQLCVWRELCISGGLDDDYDIDALEGVVYVVVIIRLHNGRVSHLHGTMMF